MHAKPDRVGEIVGDKRFVGAARGCDPLRFVTPPHARLMPGSDVVRVDEDLVFLLPAPDADTPIRRVVEDGADRRVRPASRVAVTIPHRVVLARRRHTVVGEPLRDVAEARAVGVHPVDPLDDRGCRGVRFEAVQSLPQVRLGQVGVWAGVDEPVTVRRPAAEVPCRVLREC